MNEKIDNIALYNMIQSMDVFASNKHLHDLNFISASIGKLLPELNFNEHLEIAKQSAFYQILANQEVANSSIIKQVTKPTLDFSKKILVTFHYSSYRIFNSLLISWSVPFKLVADANYIHNQGEKTIKSYHDIAQNLKVKPYDFEIINAENRTVILKCMEAIKNGYALVFYADGNSGVGGMTKQQSNLLKIPFLHSSIYVRKGIATLASLLKTPITSITIQRNIFSDSLELDIREGIEFPKDRKNEEEIKECMSSIYLNLEDQLYRNPGQWEGWFYYHNFMDFEPVNTSSAIKHQMPLGETIFNHRFYGIGILGESLYYILNKKTLRLVPIEENLFNELLNIVRTNKVTKKFPALKSLISEGILNTH